MVFEEPGWCPVGKVKGLGERVGEGVLASGDSGMWATDLRLLGVVGVLATCSPLAPECSLCLRPCREDGR